LRAQDKAADPVHAYAAFRGAAGKD
jgi:hypothetical protein